MPRSNDLNNIGSSSSRSTLAGKVIIVTGASSGIGESTAYELARYSPILVLAARRKSRLLRVAKKITGKAEDVFVVKTDVSKEAEAERLVRKTIQRFGRVDILLNIAGWGSYGWFEKLKVSDIKEQFEVNVFGPLYLIHAVIPIMQKQRSGHIINMVSFASRVAAPPMTVYAGTKYALEGLSDGLRRELLPWGIRVSRVHPGGVTGTEYNQKASQRGNVIFKSPGIGHISRQQVAREIRKLIEHPRPELMLGWVYAFPAFANRYFPGLVDFVMKIYVTQQRRKELKRTSNRKSKPIAEKKPNRRAPK